MQIQIHSNHSVDNSESFIRWASSEVGGALERFQNRITRVDVYLNDMNQDKTGGRAKRCSIEAKLEGMPVVVASHDGDSLALALNGAADKVVKVLDRKVGRINGKKGRTPMGGEVFALSLIHISTGTQDNNRDSNWGWIGLLGLTGLAGLKGMKRNDNRDRSTYAGGPTTART